MKGKRNEEQFRFKKERIETLKSLEDSGYIDLNFKDPVSKKTIMDFISDEIDRYSKMQHDHSGKIREYTSIYNLLKIFEVKHASEL